MKIFTVHSLGIFNLWIFMLLFALPILITVINQPGIFHATSEKFKNKRETTEFRKFIAAKFFMMFYFIYAILVPIPFSSVLFIPGLIVYSAGFICYVSAWVVIFKTGPDKLFDKGPFRFSRHPVYVSSFILFTGAGLMSSSLLFLILSILVGITHVRNGRSEEISCMEVYGEEYLQYIKRTPKWFGIPKKQQ